MQTTAAQPELFSILFMNFYCLAFHFFFFSGMCTTVTFIMLFMQPLLLCVNASTREGIIRRRRFLSLMWNKNENCSALVGWNVIFPRISLMIKVFMKKAENSRFFTVHTNIFPFSVLMIFFSAVLEHQQHTSHGRGNNDCGIVKGRRTVGKAGR